VITTRVLEDWIGKSLLSFRSKQPKGPSLWTTTCIQSPTSSSDIAEDSAPVWDPELKITMVPSSASTTQSLVHPTRHQPLPHSRQLLPGGTRLIEACKREVCGVLPATVPICIPRHCQRQSGNAAANSIFKQRSMM
jgi:hypothetical protein